MIRYDQAVTLQKERGWTRASLVAGAQHIGMSPAIIGLLPRGSAELLEVHLKYSSMPYTFNAMLSKPSF